MSARHAHTTYQVAVRSHNLNLNIPEDRMQRTEYSNAVQRNFARLQYQEIDKVIVSQPC